MAIISFWSNSERETGQTFSSVAVATMMAIDHNYKILHISTGFKEKTVENCFWDPSKAAGIASIVGGKQSGINNGIEGLVKIIQSNRTSSNIVSDYARVVFKDRFDILPAPATEDIEEYNDTVKLYPRLAKIADKDYDLVFLDINKKMNKDLQRELLEQSDAIVLVIKQGANIIEETLALRENDELFKKKNVILLIGKCDKFSRFNINNITRELKEKNKVCAISYNTLFFDASSEGQVADFFLNNRTISDKSDRNYTFMSECQRTCDTIITKLQELQMRL